MEKERKTMQRIKLNQNTGKWGNCKGWNIPKHAAFTTFSNKHDIRGLLRDFIVLQKNIKTDDGREMIGSSFTDIILFCVEFTHKQMKENGIFENE
jgi:hypothetical protein